MREKLWYFCLWVRHKRADNGRWLSNLLIDSLFMANNAKSDILTHGYLASIQESSELSANYSIAVVKDARTIGEQRERYSHAACLNLFVQECLLTRRRPEIMSLFFFIVLVVNFLPAHSSPTSYITEYYSNDSYKQEVLCQYKFMRLENASKYLARWGAMGQINTMAQP